MSQTSSLALSDGFFLVLLLQKTLEAFMIILALFELLYLLALQAGSVLSDGRGSAPATHKGVKDPNFGTSAAAAV